MVQKVFLVVDYSGFDRFLKYPYLFVSAGVCYKNGRFYKPSISFRPKELFLDSGAFSLIQKYNDYPYSFKQYIAFAKILKADYVAVMDYPCEPNSKIKLNVKERILKTVENAQRLMDLAPEINWVFVIQGWTKEDYLYCLDVAKDHDLLTPLTAIGSVCVRKNLHEVKEIVLTIRDEIPDKIKLHCFGLDIRFAEDLAIFNSIYSFDTHAWCIYKGFPRRQSEKFDKLAAYLKRLDKMFRLRNQTTLNFFREG